MLSEIKPHWNTNPAIYIQNLLLVGKYPSRNQKIENKPGATSFANNRIRFVLTIVFVCLYTTTSHYHHCANLSEDIELIKCLSDFVECVSKIRHILSVINYTMRGAVFLVYPFPCDD